MNTRSLVSFLVIVVVVGLIGWFVTSNGLLPGRKSTAADSGKSSGQQAVFLTNGQVYFGNFSQGKDYSTLTDVYYLQLAQSPQPDDKKTSASQPQISLVKLGNELHAPVDEMKINNDHILFFEDMKDSAKVVQAIEKYKKDGPTQTGTQPQTEVQATAAP